jgi:hypothetical protein
MSKMTHKKWKQIGRICGYDGTRTASVWSEDADRLRKACPYETWKRIGKTVKIAGGLYGDVIDEIEVDFSGKVDVNVRPTQKRGIFDATLKWEPSKPYEHRHAETGNMYHDILSEQLRSILEAHGFEVIGETEYSSDGGSQYRGGDNPSFSVTAKAKRLGGPDIDLDEPGVDNDEKKIYNIDPDV